MPAKNYYELLEIQVTASTDEVKRAFRQQIARYHPDKVQHLGKEFQTLAAERAADLTEAYRVLADAALREEYDRLSRDAADAPQRVGDAQRAARADDSTPAPQSQPAADPPPRPGAPESPREAGHLFSRERESGDAFVKKATVGRVRQALATTFGTFDDSPVRGFDLACVPKAKLFSRTKSPRLLVRFVARVDGAAVGDAWMHAAKWPVPPTDEICLFLMGPSLVSPRELADAIHEQRRKARAAKMTLIPVDTRDWHAYVPLDAPPVVKTVLEHLRGG